MYKKSVKVLGILLISVFLISNVLAFSLSDFFDLFKPQVSLSPPDTKYQSLYKHFSPSVGYSWKSGSSDRIAIWNSSGYRYNWDGTKWVGTSTSSGLPNTFKTTVGYSWITPQGYTKISLWNSTGANYVWDSSSPNTWTLSNLQQGQPNKIHIGFIPTVGYSWIGADKGIRVGLWNSTGGQFIWNNNTGDWVYSKPSGTGNDGKLPTGFVPTVGYSWLANDNIVRIALWNSQGQQYQYHMTNNNWTLITLTGNGNDGKLPSWFKPVIGYYESVNKQIVLFNSSGSAYGYLLSNSNWSLIRNQTYPVTGTPSPECTTEGATQCNVDDVQVCSGGFWTFSKTCPGSCLNGSCSVSCTDNDFDPTDNIASLDYYYTKSNVTYYNGSVNQFYIDSCSSNVLLEYSCSSTNVTLTNYTCPDGCSNGACSGSPEKSCVDTDDGEDFTDEGQVTYIFNDEEFEFDDVCETSRKLKEWSCNDDDDPEYTMYTCNSGYRCSDGECVLEGSSGTPGGGSGNECSTSKCEGSFYVECIDGNYITPAQIPGQCGYQVGFGDDECIDDFDCSEGSVCSNGICVISEDGQDSSGTVFAVLIVILVIVIIVVGVIIFFVMKKRNESSKHSGPKSGSPSPPTIRTSPSSPPGFPFSR